MSIMNMPTNFAYSNGDKSKIKISLVSKLLKFCSNYFWGAGACSVQLWANLYALTLIWLTHTFERGHKFASDEEVKKCACMACHSPQFSFCQGTKTLDHNWTNCTDKQMDYTKKQCPYTLSLAMMLISKHKLRIHSDSLMSFQQSSASYFFHLPATLHNLHNS
jgi:hypothetical protein